MIRINGYEVYVPPKQSIEYQLINPNLVYDSIPSSQATIPTFPAVKENRAIFGYYEDPQAGAYIPELLYEHFHNGELIRQGYFFLTEASDDTGYKGSFTDRLGLFFGDFQNQSIREIDFGSLTIPEIMPMVITDPDPVCCFPTIVNENFYGSNGATIFYAGKINDYQDGEYTFSPAVPQFFACWVLKKIATITGTKITGSFFDHPVWSQLILVNLREVETGSISVKNHLPDFSIVQFILELRKIANLKFTFNSVEKSLVIDFWEDNLKAPTTENWTSKAVAGETKTPENNTRIQFIMQVDGADALAKDKPEPLADYLSEEVGGSSNGIAKLEMKFSTLTVDQESGLAACKQEGQSSQFAQDAKTWAPRLMFWHGLVDDYPRALPSMGDILLSPAALAATTWTEYTALKQRQFYLTKDFVINEADIAKLDFGKKYHVAGVDYIIAQINIAVPIQGVATALLIGGV